MWQMTYLGVVIGHHDVTVGLAWQMTTFPAWQGDISMEMASFCADGPEFWGNVNLEEEDVFLDNSLVSWSLAVTSSIVAVTWSVGMDKQAGQLGIVDWWLLEPWGWGMGKGILTIR
ncbi:hypothetical protein EDD15DRAFT_2191045 [Pisolithus albus]|nr:hypothetical protein EDD15DRAFT_2191045 [Pisolithus albus]